MSSHGGPSRQLCSPRNIEKDKAVLVYILKAKIHPETMSELTMLVENCKLERSNKSHQGPSVVSELNLELTGDVEEADVIVTATNMRQRLERHIDWRIAKTKAIVTPSWLQDSVKSNRFLPCSSYVAVHSLEDENSQNQDTVRELSSGSSFHFPSGTEKDIFLQTEQNELIVATEVESLSYNAKYSCLRPSPLTCPNQSLVKEIDIIRRGRNVEGEERSMLSYSRAISVIKAYPHVITERNIQDLRGLPFLGEKILSLVLLASSPFTFHYSHICQIEEFLKTGRITEAQKILADPRFQSLSTFITIYGIGPHTARRLYDLGLRTLEELERYYEVKTGVSEETVSLLDTEAIANTEAAEEQSIKMGLAL
jgi:DNA polymerase mu